ncbi:hypothetical protein [Methylocystis sp.]|uniref:hypothetical protein n=1 Tax=Methylocystis sp. TaxID=1911079 RepID=UPI003DA31C2E
MKPPRLVLLAAAGLSLVAFAGCAPVGDVAIKANGATLSNKDVDLFTTFLCNYRAGANAEAGSAGQVPRQQARTEAARLLAESLVSDKAADAAKVPDELDGVEQSLQQFSAVIDQSASGDDRARLKNLLIDSITSSSRLETAIKTEMVNELGEAIDQLPQDQGQAIFDEKYAALIASAVSSSDLEIDPVFGIDPDTLTPGADSSLSAPVSQYAQDSTQLQAPAEWLASLPANQLCG